jgi:predicted transcriptional regulator
MYGWEKMRKNHVAILAGKWGLLGKILDGRKTIESRWYVHRTNPWNNISAGDVVYFKESGKPVEAKADVEKVLFFENLDDEKIKMVIGKYGERIGISLDNSEFYSGKNYCILVFLKNVKKVEPFQVDKKGFGNAAAWLTVSDINKIKIG